MSAKVETELQQLLFTQSTFIHHPQHLLHGPLKQIGVAGHVHRARVKLAGQVPGPDTWQAAGVVDEPHILPRLQWGGPAASSWATTGQRWWLRATWTAISARGGCEVTDCLHPLPSRPKLFQGSARR